MDRSAETLRLLDELLEQLLELPSGERQVRLADIGDRDRDLADELARLLALCEGEAAVLSPAGALHGAIAQECLLGEEAVPSLAAGTPLGPYVVDGLLGRGGMSEVYRAERRFDGFSQAVALKILRSDRVGPSLRERLLAEQRTLVRLDHPNIARFLDAGFDGDGDAYLAMELVEGEPVSTHAAATGADLRARVGWMIDLCDALAHAHAQLVAHCDIKPSNVLIDRSGRLRLLDFGISRLLGEPPGEAAGPDGLKLFTPDYAAPEQRAGEPVGTGTDIFQVGALLYRLVVGCSWSGPRAASRAQGGAPEPLPPSRGLAAWEAEEAVRANAAGCGFASPAALARRLRGDFDAIVMKCLARQPADRYGSIDQLKRDLRAWMQDRPTSVLRPTPAQRARKWLRRHRRGVAATAAGLGVVLAIAYVSAERIAEEQRASERERERAQALEGFLGRVFEQASPYLKDPDGDPMQTLVQVGDALLQGDPDLDRESRSRMSAVMARLELDVGWPARAEARIRQALASGQAPATEFELARLLGLALTQQDRLDEAAETLGRALALETALPADARRRANLQSHLGEVFRRQGRLPEAGEHAEPAIASLLATPGALDRESLQSLIRAVLYLDMKGERGPRLDDIARRIAAGGAPGEPVPQKAGRLFALSYVQSVAGDAAGSAANAAQAAGLFSQVLGEGHPQVVKAWAMACNSHRVAGALAPARDACGRALQATVEAGRSSSDDARVLRTNLAGIDLASGDLRAMERDLAELDAMGPGSGEPYQQLVALMFRGQLDLRRGRAEAALVPLQAAARIQEQAFPDNAELVANIGPPLARALFAAGRHDAARQILARVGESLDGGSAPGDLRGDYLLARAEIAAGQGDAARAREAAEGALAAYRQAPGVSPAGRAWVLLDVAALLHRLGDAGMAARLAREAQATPLSPDGTPGLWARAVLLSAVAPPAPEPAVLRQAQALCGTHFGEDSPRCRAD